VCCSLGERPISVPEDFNNWLRPTHTVKDNLVYSESKGLNVNQARYWWLTFIILATLEAEIRRIMVYSQLWQIVLENT
jgi:hypothetical protein